MLSTRFHPNIEDESHIKTGVLYFLSPIIDEESRLPLFSLEQNFNLLSLLPIFLGQIRHYNFSFLTACFFQCLTILIALLWTSSSCFTFLLCPHNFCWCLTSAEQSTLHLQSQPRAASFCFALAQHYFILLKFVF